MNYLNKNLMIMVILKFGELHTAVYIGWFLSAIFSIHKEFYHLWLER